MGVSGVFLNASGAPRVVTPPDSSTWLPVPPTTVRDFARTDRATAGVRLVQPRELATTNVVVETSVFDATGRRVATVPAVLTAHAFDADRVADHRVELPLAELEPGDYLLPVTATLGRTKIARTARFRVH